MNNNHVACEKWVFGIPNIARSKTGIADFFFSLRDRTSEKNKMNNNIRSFLDILGFNIYAVKSAGANPKIPGIERSKQKNVRYKNNRVAPGNSADLQI